MIANFEAALILQMVCIVLFVTFFIVQFSSSHLSLDCSRSYLLIHIIALSLTKLVFITAIVRYIKRIWIWNIRSNWFALSGEWLLLCIIAGILNIQTFTFPRHSQALKPADSHSLLKHSEQVFRAWHSLKTIKSLLPFLVLHRVLPCLHCLWELLHTPTINGNYLTFNL